MNTEFPLTVAETALAADVSPKVVRHALARGIVRRVSRKREAPVPAAAAYALAVVKHAPVEFGSADQRALFDALLKRTSGTWRLQLERGALSLETEPVRTTFEAGELLRAVERRVELLQRMRERIHRDAHILGGAPVFKGTRAAVRRVGALMLRDDMTRDEVQAEYPRLNDEDLDIAALWVRLNPKPRGRPLKPFRLIRLPAARD